MLRIVNNMTEEHFNPRPHAGDDQAMLLLIGHWYEFQPTSPCGGRLEHPGQLSEEAYISTHVPMRGTTTGHDIK